jgi:hypothetical protein
MPSNTAAQTPSEVNASGRTGSIAAGVVPSSSAGGWFIIKELLALDSIARAAIIA